MHNHANYSSLIWSVADDVLRGVFKPSEYGRLILPFVVMRRLDCVLEPKKEQARQHYEMVKDQLSHPFESICETIALPFYNISNFDLSSLRNDAHNILLNFQNYVQGYSANVFEIIENFSLTPFVEKLDKHKRLYLLIDKFSEFDFHPEVVDNHQMGSIYEELLRKFSEMSNEESGDHFTPRDIVKLLVAFVFGSEKKELQLQGKICNIFDPCCGTGGMLTIAKQWLQENINPQLQIGLYGQELNDITYSICKSDLLMIGDDPKNIQGPSSSISEDRHQRKFNYMITNPPFGVSWKSEAEFVKKEAQDPLGRFSAGLPKTSDGSLLFLQHLIHKMDNGARIGIIFNGSPLFSGNAGGGESEIRKWIIENDWLECVLSLPDRMFFNTGITTYVWILSNKKDDARQGKVQLIDGSSFFTPMKKSLGEKGKYISSEQIEQLFEIYAKNQENEFSKIYANQFFGYTKVVVQQPLLENGRVVKDRQGRVKADAAKKQEERVPLLEDIDAYYEAEVKVHLPDSWLDRSKDKIGYEINFNRYFYKFKPLRSLEEISNDLKALDKEIAQLTAEIENETL